MKRHRRCAVLRGEPHWTEARALRLLAHHDPGAVLWVTDGECAGWSGETTAPSGARKLLGRAFDAVVIDLHREVDANLIGQCHGFVWGGGTLIFRLPPLGEEPSEARARSTVYPFQPADVRLRFLERLERSLPADAAPELECLAPPDHAVQGTSEQSSLVDALEALLRSDTPSCAAVLADRGRGKSAALGLALGRLSGEPVRVAVTAGSEEATHEVFRFAADGTTDRDELKPVSLVELIYGPGEYDVILVDEAAQIPVPVLQRLVGRHPEARMAFATTTRGYEGTGRGFTLRFIEWLREQAREVHIFELHEPIRWDRGDPLEAMLFQALLMATEAPPTPDEFDPAQAEHIELDRDRLLEDEAQLEAFFGLLVHAHYRTTPDDLRRILDGPNIRLHALMYEGMVVAATMVAFEGGLPADICQDLYWGRRRLRGHALAENFCGHLGRPDAGALKILRSVRIAVPPALRRLGLATKLVQAIHAHYQPDIFGTLFGATPELLRFRRSVGYEVVRVGASRGTRTGEPAVMMLRPVSPAGEDLIGALRSDLARDLPLQLELMEAGHEIALDPALRQGLSIGLPEPMPLQDEAVSRVVAAYAFGSRTQEAACVALRAYVQRHPGHIEGLGAQERALIEARILEGAGWSDTQKRAALPSIPAAMRAMRRAIRALVERATPEIIPDSMD